MGRAMGCLARLIPCRAGADVGLRCANPTYFGGLAVAQRLCGAFQVDIEKTRGLLGWMPLLLLDEGLGGGGDAKTLK